MGICEVLTIIFVVCKLIGIISWSWWLVLLPEIIAVAFYIIAFIVTIATGLSVNKAIKKQFKDWR